MGTALKQVFEFEMTPFMTSAILGAFSIVIAIIAVIGIRLYLKNKREVIATSKSDVEKNLGDGI